MMIVAQETHNVLNLVYNQIPPLLLKLAEISQDVSENWIEGLCEMPELIRVLCLKAPKRVNQSIPLKKTSSVS